MGRLCNLLETRNLLLDPLVSFVLLWLLRLLLGVLLLGSFERFRLSKVPAMLILHMALCVFECRIRSGGSYSSEGPG